MEKKHTPTPWMVSRGAQQYPFSIESGSKTVALIPTVKPMGTGEFETRMSDAIFETEANAEFICRAVNNHYRLKQENEILLEVCKRLVSDNWKTRVKGQKVVVNSDYLEDIEQAIQNATE